VHRDYTPITQLDSTTICTQRLCAASQGRARSFSRFPIREPL